MKISGIYYMLHVVYILWRKVICLHLITTDTGGSDISQSIGRQQTADSGVRYTIHQLKLWLQGRKKRAPKLKKQAL